MSGTPELRGWQIKGREACLRAWRNNPSAKVLVAACPGAGKTIFSCSLAKEKHAVGEVDLIVVISPTISIQRQWKEQLKHFGLKVADQPTNSAFRERMETGECMTGGHHGISLTYSQVARDRELFVELLCRRKVLLIADEVQHADDEMAFGVALECMADYATLKLALSGTPFNSRGGSLAMCETREALDDEGRPIRITVPVYEYNYGQAIADTACRVIEFVKIWGKAKTSYVTKDGNKEKVVDLATAKKTDSIGMLLDTEGDFMSGLLDEGLSALAEIKDTDKRAGMLVVAKDKDHGSRLAKMIEERIGSNQKWSAYSVIEIYNDTPKAHDRIKSLNHDTTDIVVTVRMISEGVDVKRLRVGVYASDYLTKMFFLQFCGRFCRYEDRLDGGQFAKVVIPAHVLLLQYAEEIERMVFESLLSGSGDPVEKTVDGHKAEFIDNNTELDGDGLLFRGEHFDERSLADAWFKKFPRLKGLIPEAVAIQCAKDENLHGSSHHEASAAEVSWRKKNEKLVGAICRYLKANGAVGNVYQEVNGKANKAVGLKRVDGLVDEETFQRRHAYLHSWLTQLRYGDNLDAIA